jgi:pilus assembly protein Flp/PilA
MPLRHSEDGPAAQAALLYVLYAESVASERTLEMKDPILKLFVKIQVWTMSEEGQDLAEYALVVALVAFGATAGLKNLGSGLKTAFTTISTTLASSLT